MKTIIARLTALTFIINIVSAKAQSYHLKSVGEQKPFSLWIYHSTDGKGAFAQYDGKTGLIVLKPDRFKNGLTIHYRWLEVVKGKTTGTYDLVIENGRVLNGFYKRVPDHRQFKLSESGTKDSDNNFQKMLLNDFLISYSTDASANHFYLNDASGRGQTINTDALDALSASRRSYVDEMPVADQVKAAIAALNGKEIYGRKIALLESEEQV